MLFYLVREVVCLRALLAPVEDFDWRRWTRLHVADLLLPLALLVPADPHPLDHGDGGVRDGADARAERDPAIATAGTRRPGTPVVTGQAQGRR
jgi:hypothetical protein